MSLTPNIPLCRSAGCPFVCVICESACLPESQFVEMITAMEVLAHLTTCCGLPKCFYLKSPY